jgi:hypothetical protein
VWQNACEAPGEVEFEGEVHISGTADLIEEECAGAALGYQMITTNIAGPLRAALNESAGETTPQELGTVTAAHSGLGVSVPITVGSGVGTYMDSDQDVDAVLVCTDYFTIESKARAYIKVRANSTLIDLFAAVKTNMSSRSTTTIDFVTCPHKH